MPNAALADSTGPFGLAYEYMFNPTVGKIIMALAVMACLGSLLGWQFTLAQTGKSAAEERMFPAFFSKVNKMGAPITGMIVLGVVQTLLALSTISPTLSEQFSALVNLAVVTNVIPYVVALSSLVIMMKRAKVPQGKYRFDVVIAVVAMGYSVFALYASGMEAVMGGMLVLGIAYIVWGFIAPRFATAPRLPPTEPGRSDRGPRNHTRGEQSCKLNDSQPRAAIAAACEAAQLRYRAMSVSPCRHAGFGGNAGPHPGDGQYQARLSGRCPPVFLPERGRVRPRATPSRYASRSPTRSRKDWRCRA